MVADRQVHAAQDVMTAYYWMHGQAADVLADLGRPAPGASPPALLTMLDDKDLPIPLRSKAARALGKLNFGDNLPAAGRYLKALAELRATPWAAISPPIAGGSGSSLPTLKGPEKFPVVDPQRPGIQRRSAKDIAGVRQGNLRQNEP